MEIADAITDRPKGFTIGRRHFCLYPLTLGKAYLTQRVYSMLGIDNENMNIQPMLEALRVVVANRDNVALLLAYYTLQAKKDLLNHRTVTIRKNMLARELDDSDMASLLIYCTTLDKTTDIMHYLGIDKEHERMNDVLKVKDSHNTFSFGAKTIYGSVIDAACERYGWEYDYVVWGISYTNLRLMLADRSSSIYLTAEEAKHVHASSSNDIIDGDNKEHVMAAIIGTNWN